MPYARRPLYVLLRMDRLIGAKLDVGQRKDKKIFVLFCFSAKCAKMAVTSSGQKSLTKNYDNNEVKNAS